MSLFGYGFLRKTSETTGDEIAAAAARREQQEKAAREKQVKDTAAAAAKAAGCDWAVLEVGRLFVVGWCDRV